MKHLKKYKVFESKSDIESILKRYNIRNYTINEDGTVDGDVDLYLYKRGSIGGVLTKMPVKFRNVSGDFYCNNNKLISLEGCPESVGGDFYCHNNKLTSLKYCPVEVSGDFYCAYNKLTSLKGCPKTIGGHFVCDSNKIVKLDFIPDYVGGNFYINNNPLDPRWIGSSNWDILELDVVQGVIK